MKGILPKLGGACNSVPGIKIIQKCSAVMIIANRDIKSGEEINIKYTHIDEHMDRNERRDA